MNFDEPWGCDVAENFRVDGAERFLALSKALKAAGQTELRKDLNKSMKDAVKPLIPKARDAAGRMLPQKGGLAKKVSKTPIRPQVRTGQDTAGVRLVVGKRRGSAAASTNRGTVSHPVFKTGVWVQQSVTPGWFDATLEAEAPAVTRQAIEDALEVMSQRVVRDV